MNGTDTSAGADVTPLSTCFGYANLGLPLNPRVAIYYQTTPDPFGFTPNPFGFAFRDLGLGTFPQKRPRLRPQSERGLDIIGAGGRRPDAGDDGAQCGHDTGTVPHHRGRPADPVLPEGVLSQRLRQEPEATRPFLQHARRVCGESDVGKLPGGHDGKGGLLAHARGPEQHRHDGREPRLDGCRRRT